MPLNNQSVRGTIFARASGAGRAGVAVFRLSGPDALSIGQKLVGDLPAPRAVRLVDVVDPGSGDLIDQGLALPFAAPASFTGEDVVELHLHGSRAVEMALADALIALGARPAEAGEFTLRALRNGKLDLAQTEALADLIDAETKQQRKQALAQLDGRLSSLAEAWRGRILAVMAPLEADIDFPDEGDVPAAVAARAGPAIASLKVELEQFIDSADIGMRIREGVDIAIIGAPNAGKSSLINALAGADVAIVSDTPGTTRDVVEVRLDLSGVIATVADTAGLRSHTDDKIEAEGVRRATARAISADVRVLVVEPGKHVSRETIQPYLDDNLLSANVDKDRPLLRSNDFVIWSKSDLFTPPDFSLPSDISVHTLSAKTGDGVPALIAALSERIARDIPDGAVLTRARHVAAVQEAIEALGRAASNLSIAAELASEDARMAARALGRITGAVGVEDVLGEIFSSFCIGK